MTVTINGSTGITANDGSVFTNASGDTGMGTSSPIKRLSLQTPTVSCEQTWRMDAGKADYRTWNLVVDGGNSTTANNMSLRLLNDSGSTGYSTGMTINGTTGVFSTLVSRGISAGSVPVGSVIQTQWNNFTVNYTGNSSSYVQVTAFNQTFTPLFASSKVYVTFNTGINLICDGSVALTRNGSIIKDTWFGSSRQDDQFDYPQASGFYLDSPGTTSTVTYGIQVRATGCSNIVRIGGSDNHQSWTFMEIAA
jgi:hypothetical protein